VQAIAGGYTCEDHPVTRGRVPENSPASREVLTPSPSAATSRAPCTARSRSHGCRCTSARESAFPPARGNPTTCARKHA